MEKITVTYTERHSYKKYDDGRIIGYLNEEVIADYIPEMVGIGMEHEPVPTVGYRYTGTERDGGTIMPCQDPSDYGQLTNAIIRASITESEEMAIHRHHSNDPVLYDEEWNDYNELCENAKAQAKMWLGL